MNSNANNTSTVFKVALIASITLCILVYINKSGTSLETFNQTYVQAVQAPKVLQVKQILFWNRFFSDPTYEFGVGSQPFVSHKCAVKDCFITRDRTERPVDQFDAIIFHGPEYDPSHPDNTPKSRLQHQRYVYFSMESPLNRPANAKFDGFFNWTMTYRADSDILTPYFEFYDADGRRASFLDDPPWKNQTNALQSSRNTSIYQSKKKPIAWFASNCHSKNNRQELVKNLQKILSVDVYGGCGPFKCPRNDERVCYDMLREDYFFYLSFENSNCRDYITEKLTNAMLNDVIPVVYGGADFPRILPPDSYIDASKLSVGDLADKLKFTMLNATEYLSYFWWKDFYRLTSRTDPQNQPFCKLCEMLHDPDAPPKQYTDFKTWWNGDSSAKVCEGGKSR